jgi:heme-degrading monooxygenase HmoA
MFARVSTYELQEGRASEAVGAFEPALEHIRALEGLVEAYVLVEPDGRSMVSVTLWESLDAMERSRVTATRVRNDAVQDAGVEVISSCEYDVALRVGAADAMAGRSSS